MKKILLFSFFAFATIANAQTATLLSENFEGVTDDSLPSGWSLLYSSTNVPTVYNMFTVKDKTTCPNNEISDDKVLQVVNNSGGCDYVKYPSGYSGNYNTIAYVKVNAIGYENIKLSVKWKAGGGSTHAGSLQFASAANPVFNSFTTLSSALADGTGLNSMHSNPTTQTVTDFILPTTGAGWATSGVSNTRDKEFYIGFRFVTSLATGAAINQPGLSIDDLVITGTPIETMAISDINKANTSVYPNPFTDVLKISDIKGVKSISVKDVSGRYVKTLTPATELNLSSLKSGMYIVNLIMEDGSSNSFKTVKK